MRVIAQLSTARGRLSLTSRPGRRRLHETPGYMRRRRAASAVVLALLVLAAAAAPVLPAAAHPQTQPQELSAAEFAQLVRDLSEEGGYFRSDNFTSNETSYLSVVDKLRQLGAAGGAYIGVGPEQNFTYIAKVRPRIAFVIDIRRQAVIQHLMYKAIFHLASNRLQFLSRLLSRPLGKEAPSPDAPIDQLLNFFSKAPADDAAYTANLADIRQVIAKEFQVPLSESDQTGLDYVYKHFRTDGLDIAFSMDGLRGGYFPSLKELILQTDQHGKLGNFLASADDYNFVRDMQRRNLIVPVVGDFGGKKAIAAVGEYLRRHGYIVTAFYTSNVEQYLFDGGSFSAFANNVRKLPLNEHSVFIRSVSGRYTHPARLPGHRNTTLLEQMTLFLSDFDAGRYSSYFDMVNTHYIAGDN